MITSHRQQILGYAVVLLFAANTSFRGLSSSGIVIYSNSLSSYKINLLAAPYLQATSYPPPSTESSPTAYPAPQTPTFLPPSPTANHASSTTSIIPTVPGSGSFTLTPPQSGTGIVPSPQPGTQISTSIQNNDLFLTENAEMGQSQATLIPTDIPSSSPTTTISPTLIYSLSTVVPDQSFKMNWMAFIIGFISIIGIGCGIGWWFFRRQGSRT
jgi:hypothetical protein